ncbi:MAG: hypothetical protein KC996_02195 [Phycisphaerales bacterium]|nr:hypothetical protein [Phycisphaerales bacterium]
MSSVDTEQLGVLMGELERTCPQTLKATALDFVPTMMEPQDELIHELVFSLLLWESSLTHAIRGMQLIRESLADYNELRVCFPEDLSGIIGTRYPGSLERSERIIAALNSVFQREQSLSLGVLRELSKHDARRYLTTLSGVPGFVAARVTLIGLGGHAFPIDGLLMKYLAKQGVLVGTASQEQHMGRMERAVRAADSHRLYCMIEYWADQKRNSSSATETLEENGRPADQSRNAS